MDNDASRKTSTRPGQPPPSGMTGDPTIDIGAASGPAAEAEVFPRPFGRYELRAILGRGGMGAVYLAHDPVLDRLVALKIPRPIGEDSAVWRVRFQTEARASATLNHPNVCPVFEVGEVDRQPYLAMAYIEGEDLAARLKREGRPPVPEAVALVLELARAMTEAHARGIVHRDLKPSNVMIDRRGRPIIMDFGLALRTSTADDLRMTLSGVAMGTPSYMPPEQAGGDHDAIGPPADVYTLGVILYELLTGRVPFQAPTFGKLLAQIERDAPEAPSTLNPNVDLGLDALVSRAMAKDPKDRFESAGALADALDRYVRGDWGPGDWSTGPTAASTTSELRARQSDKDATTAARRPRWPVVAVGALGLALIALLGVTLYLKTDYGQLVVELSDPGASVDVRVNGQELTLDPNGSPVRIRAGKGQTLEVAGPGFTTVSQQFDLVRGGKTVVRVRLEPNRPVAGPSPNSLRRTPEPPSIPVPPAKPVVFPAQATLIELPGWQIVVDATRERLQEWLDERDDDDHSVTWLDVAQVGDKPLFAAIAALDDRKADWKAYLDLAADEVNDTKALGRRFNIHQYYLTSFSGYVQDNAVQVAALIHANDRGGTLDGSVGILRFQDALGHLNRPDLIARLVRPFPIGGNQALCALYMESTLLPQPQPTAAIAGPNQLADLLKTYRANGYRPIGVVAFEDGGVRRFAATFRKDPDKTAWEVRQDLTTSDLLKSAATMADQGLAPASISAYPWDGAVRYAVVWQQR